VIVNILDDGSASRFLLKVSTPSVHRPGRQCGIRLVTKGGSMANGTYELPLNVTSAKFALGRKPLSSSTSTPGMRRSDAQRPVSQQRSIDSKTCNSSMTYPQPDQANLQMQLVGSPELLGFEGGFETNSSLECSRVCAAQVSSDSWHRLACNAWTWAEPGAHKRGDSGWCWIWAGRGNAVGNCGFVSATCDNRPSPPSDWPCCAAGWNCPNPIVAIDV
jgi:hypothetical protein